MKQALLRFGTLFLALGVFIACDEDTTGLDGTPSEVNIRVFVDNDESETFEAEIDDPVSNAGVTLTNNETEASLQTTTDAQGIASFDDVPAGSYTATLNIDPPEGTEPAMTDFELTIVAPFEGGTVEDQFRFVPGVATLQEARGAAGGDTVTTIGVVTAGQGVFSGSGFYLQDATAGIATFGADETLEISAGDSVRITGARGAFNGEAQLSLGDSVEVLGTTDVPEPAAATPGDIRAGDFQGQLVTLSGVTVEESSDFIVSVSGDTDTTNVFLGQTSDVGGSDLPVGATCDITGIATVFNSGFDIDDPGADPNQAGDFQIKPRSIADVSCEGGTGGPAADSVDVAGARAASDGATVTTVGIVTAGQGTFNDSGFYFQDGTAGIATFGADTALSLSPGDSVRVTGTRGGFNGEVQIEGASAELLGSTSVPAPVSVTSADIRAGDNQGELAVITATVDSINGGTVFLSDSDGETTAFLDSTTGVTADDFTVGEVHEITGVLSVFSSDATLDPDEFQIKPRSPADVVVQ